MHVTAGDPISEARLAVLSAVVDGDAGLAFAIVNDLMSEGFSFESILFDVLAPLQDDVGRRWQHGDFGIAEEHAATGAVETVVALLAGSFRQPDDGHHVVVACADGDTHSLPARMVAAYLLYLGWRVTFLGPSVPADDLALFLTDAKPDALILSCAIVTRLPGARKSIRAAHAAGVPVVAGGRGFGYDASRAQALGADSWVGSPLVLDELLRTWNPEPSTAEAQALEPGDEYFALRTTEHSALETASSSALSTLGLRIAEAGPAGADRHQVAADLRLLHEAVLAALLLRESSPVVEFARWHDDFHAPPRSSQSTTPVILRELRDAVQATSPTACRYLDEAIDTISA